MQAVRLQIPLCPPHLRRRRGGRQGCSCIPARSTLLMLSNEGVHVRNGVSVYIQRRFIQKRRGRCRARVRPLQQQARHRHGAAAPPLRFSSFLVLLLLKAAPLFFRFPLELAQRLRSGTVGGLHGGNAIHSSFRPRAQRCPRGLPSGLGPALPPGRVRACIIERATVEEMVTGQGPPKVAEPLTSTRRRRRKAHRRTHYVIMMRNNGGARVRGAYGASTGERLNGVH